MDEARHAEHWFEYFPGNFMWSQGMMMAIEMAPWGGGAFAEAHQVGRRLMGRVGDNEAWYEEWSRQAERIEALADAEAAGGHSVTAGGLYQRASTYHFLAERFLSPADPRKNVSYRRVLRCFREAARRRMERLQWVDVPYEGGSLAAHFLPPEGEPPYRAMVFFDGLDIAKEIITPFGATELARRGVACLVVDGPGQGESLRLRGLPSRFDYEVPAAAAVDYLVSRGDVDPGRIGLMAISLGGYYAPRAAAFEKRFKICVAWGAHFDYHAVWLRRRQVMEAGGSTASAPSFQLPWVLGVADMDAAMEKLRRYTLDGVAERIECPLLVVHGANDSIVPVEMAHRLYEAAGSRVKELKVFTADETGSEHCMEDNRQLGAAWVADWIADRL
jgi:alpha-beta hydrolase superfamily lysophospholipase